MNDTGDEQHEPRWLRLAATLRSEPGGTTLARVRARLAERAAGPAWLRALSHPAALAATTLLLIVSLFAGSAILSTGGTDAERPTSVVSALLGDDGSFGLPLERGAPSGAANPDSERVSL